LGGLKLHPNADVDLCHADWLNEGKKIIKESQDKIARKGHKEEKIWIQI